MFIFRGKDYAMAIGFITVIACILWASYALEQQEIQRSIQCQEACVKF